MEEYIGDIISVILNFNLSYVATLITSVVTLFDPNPAFQYERKPDGTYTILSGNQLDRNNQVASAGFNATEIIQVDLNGNNIYVPSTSALPLPANSYVVNTPSQVYGTSPAGDIYSVFQINSGLALIEPGFSRVQVSYNYYDATAGTVNSITEYFDCPFYEGFNITAQELNNLVSYVEGGYAFLQKEIDILNQETSFALSHELWRGTSVSGQVSVVPATEGLMSGALTAGEFPHDTEPKDVSMYPTPTFSQMKVAAFTAGSSNIQLTQTTPNSPSEYGRDTSTNGTPDGSRYGFYISEAVDGSGDRCIVLVVGNYWGESSGGSTTIRHDFSAVGGAVDRVIGVQTSLVYSHITGYQGGLQSSDSPVAMSPNVSKVYPTQTGASPDVTTLGSYTRVYEEYPHNTSPTGGRYVGYIGGYVPLWMKGYYGDGNAESNNDGPNSNDNGVFSPPTSGPTNDQATGALASGYVGMTGGTWDTVNIAGENHPRLIFYPDDSTTSITLNPITYDRMTCDDFNGGDGGHGTNGLFVSALQNSQQNGTTINNGNAILPYTLGLTSVFPANGPALNSSGNSNSGCIGATLTLSGNYFNATYDSVYINGTPAPCQVLNPNTVQVTVPSTSIGPTTLQITDGRHNPSSIPFTVLGQPSISSVSPTQAPSGQNVTISGNNFGSQDSNSMVVFGTQPATIVSWSNTSIVVTVPSGVGLGPIQINVYNDCGEQSAGQFSVANPDSVVITPHVQVVSEGTTFQFTATFHAGQNAPVNVSDNANTTWYVNNEVGGEAVHGTISQSGLYTAPNSQPPDQITVKVEYYDPNNGLFESDSAVVTLAPSPTIVLSPANVQLAAGASQQYMVTLYAGGNVTDVTATSTYFVNSTPGGDLVDGTISSAGLYNAPNNLSQSTIETITANYVYDGTTLIGTAYATVGQTPSAFASITVTSQINVFLGDGRFGYVPTGTQIYAYPLQYVYVQFQELLDNQYHLPIATYLPIQQLTVSTKNALANDVANVIYNLADMVVQPDGTTQTLRTVVLGIIDPTDGRFHSIYDIANPIPGPAMGGHDIDLKSLTAKSAEEIPAFKNNKNGFSGSIMSYIDDLSNGAQKQLDFINAKNNTMLVGNCEYNPETNTFSILDSLNVVSLSKDNVYGINTSIPAQSVVIKSNQYLYIDKNNNLKVKNLGNLFKDGNDLNTIVVGIVLDKFYTEYPLLNMIDVNTSGVRDEKSSIMKIGPLIVQWGLTDEITVNKKGMLQKEIQLIEPFKKSYVSLVESFESKGGTVSTETTTQDLSSFEVKAGNLGSTNVKTKIKWLAIGN